MPTSREWHPPQARRTTAASSAYDHPRYENQDWPVITGFSESAPPTHKSMETLRYAEIRCDVYGPRGPAGTPSTPPGRL